MDPQCRPLEYWRKALPLLWINAALLKNSYWPATGPLFRLSAKNMGPLISNGTWATFTNWVFLIHKVINLGIHMSIPLSNGTRINMVKSENSLKSQVVKWSGPNTQGPCSCNSVFSLTAYIYVCFKISLWLKKKIREEKKNCDGGNHNWKEVT